LIVLVTEIASRISSIVTVVVSGKLGRCIRPERGFKGHISEERLLLLSFFGPMVRKEVSQGDEWWNVSFKGLFTSPPFPRPLKNLAARDAISVIMLIPVEIF
jgi:hypothetical protein